MGVIDIALRYPHNVNGIAADPQPDWSFDNLLSELDSIEKKFTATSDIPSAFSKKQQVKLRASKENHRCARGFVMHVSDDDTDSDSEEEADSLSIVPSKRFACDELYLSDDSEDESPLGTQCQLMEKVGLAEGALCQLANEFQLSVSEEVRNKVSALDVDLVNENKKFASLIAKIEKHREMQHERERKFDLQYRRTIAEALDNHLTVLQRDHEHISQLEERKIRDDAARQEAKRKEKALQEEKLRHEKAKVETETKLKAEIAKAEAIKAEKQALEQAAAAKLAAESLRDAAHKAVDDSKGTVKESMGSGFDARKKVQSSALVKGSENALEMERRRRRIYDDLSAQYEALKASSNQDYNKHGKIIGRHIRTITATVESIRTKVDELIKLINRSGCPKSISILLLAEKAVSNCTKKGSNIIFATSRVLVLVTSQIPEAMDILIAALNKACIYTVPKHILYSEEAFITKDAYYKAMGYEEEDGKTENTDSYLEKLSSYMKLYGALVQTEVGVENRHGLREGWTWLARFLNTLPANLYTAVALHSFLEMAGFALYRKYKNQFEKLLNIIARDFINALEGGGSQLTKAKVSLVYYIESKQFKKEPEGLQLQRHLSSDDCTF